MKPFTVLPIGYISVNNTETRLILEKAYLPAMNGLTEIDYIQILWWFDQCDNMASRNTLMVERPSRYAPIQLGTFATRSSERSNPIALSCAKINDLNEKNGTIALEYIDATDASPVLDIKPYIPSLDKVEIPQMPEWCTHWPKSIETSGEFD